MNSSQQSLRTLRALFLVVSLLATPLASSQVRVVVSEQYSAFVKPLPLDKARPQVLVYPAHSNRFGDRYVLALKGTAQLKVTVIDESTGLGKSNRVLIERELSGPARLDIPSTLGGVGIILISQDGNTPRGSTLYRIGRRPAEAREKFRDYLQGLPDTLAQNWRLPQVNITVRPCGYVNAFSSPDVVLCTELLSDLDDRQLNSAVLAILVHELAHALLTVWGLPGADNEDIADEFAVFVLGGAIPSAIDGFAKYLEGQDSIAEAAIQLQYGDKHTISVQRARNLRTAMTHLPDIQRRWSRLLAPFEIPMR